MSLHQVNAQLAAAVEEYYTAPRSKPALAKVKRLARLKVQLLEQLRVAA